jgi:hypothetical protein
MRVVRVMCHVEVICPTCGEFCAQVGLANITAAGYIGEGRAAGPIQPCNTCRKKERDSELSEYNAERERRAWGRKHGAVAKTTKPRGRA